MPSPYQGGWVVEGSTLQERKMPQNGQYTLHMIELPGPQGRDGKRRKRKKRRREEEEEVGRGMSQKLVSIDVNTLPKRESGVFLRICSRVYYFTVLRHLRALRGIDRLVAE